MTESVGVQRNRSTPAKLVGRCIVSCVSALLTHFALALIPYFFPTSSLLTLVCLSAMVLLVLLGIGGRCRRMLGVYGSAPAFVAVNVVYIWFVYVVFIRKVVSLFMDIVFNGEIAMLIFGLYSMLKRDPGRVMSGAYFLNEATSSPISEVQYQNQSSSSVNRARYCRICKAYIKGFDHHCPAFGNCIGQDNYFLFMVLLIGFLITEACFVACSFRFNKESSVPLQTILESNMPAALVTSGMLFSLLQLPWQGMFFMWHVYCICLNITTDEWINWKKYPEFQHLTATEQGIIFKNPYDKGILQNLMAFLTYRRER